MNNLRALHIILSAYFILVHSLQIYFITQRLNKIKSQKFIFFLLVATTIVSNIVLLCDWLMRFRQ